MSNCKERKDTKTTEMVKQTVVYPSPMFTMMEGKDPDTLRSPRRKRKRYSLLSEQTIEERLQAAEKSDVSKPTASSNCKLPKRQSSVHSKSELPKNNPTESSKRKLSKGDLLAQLTQGLQNGDNTLLTKAFQERNEATIVKTVKGLHWHLVHSLVKEIVTRLHSHPESPSVLVRWMKHILRLHMAHILTLPDMMSTLKEVDMYIEGLRHTVTKCYETQGKLGLLLSRISSQNLSEETAELVEPVIAYQDDSDSDNDPVPMDMGGGVESEDNWEDSDVH